MEALHTLMQKSAEELVKAQINLGFFNQLFLVPRPNNRWRPILDLSTLKKFLKTEFQNRNTKDYKDLPPARRVGNVYRLQGRLLPHTNTGSAQEVPMFSHAGSVLPIQSTTFWYVPSTH